MLAFDTTCWFRRTILFGKFIMMVIGHQCLIQIFNIVDFIGKDALHAIFLKFIKDITLKAVMAVLLDGKKMQMLNVN